MREPRQAMLACLAAGAAIGAALLPSGCDAPALTVTCPPTVGNGVSTAKGDKHLFAVSRLQLPANNTTYALDLTGSGHKVNALGGCLQALYAQGFDPQSDIDAAIRDGSTNLLLSVQTSDATFQNDLTSGITVYRGASFAGCSIAVPDGGDGDAGTPRGDCPDFSGAGSFSVDTDPTDQPAGGWPKLDGIITRGAFSSPSPETADPCSDQPPIDLTLTLPLLGLDPIPIRLHGAHVAFTSAVSDSHPKLTGQIQGSIKNADIESIVLPALTSLFNDAIVEDPSSMRSAGLLKTLDTGCTDESGALLKSDGGMVEGTAGDGIIQLCEVETNAIVSSVTSPDIQVYDAAGNYAPNPKPTAAGKDSLSFGIQFEAVPAAFTEP